MKFHASWDSLEKENHFLKAIVFVILAIAIFLCITVMAVGTKDPILIQRSCYSRMVEKSAPQPTDDEIKAFVEEAIKARFNTGWNDALFLTTEQSAFKEKEQSQLSKQNMKQKVIVNSVTLDKDQITVDADRLISVGDIRSTFKFPLKVQLKSSSRSEGNPYGLVLSEITEQTEVKK